MAAPKKNQNAAKPAEKRKTERIQIALTPEEKAMILANAAKAKKTISAYAVEKLTLPGLK